ncbi:hypothetical protein Ddye_001981 [Dipteronia dyeriana]|uniref:Endonuclease/exonuclease/phosphatase domain-containing protein n=1 Tax=Dipteronia dyeriana TaxID=168575 RepID=A0AAD9XQN6_9ROSI|nr:hypothetical protein Ddye_001981 [Dipteronia dyeriana]
MSWNIRGLGRQEKRRAVKNLVAKHNPSLFFLQETKLMHVDDKIIRSLGWNVLSKSMSVDSDGATGGLISLWSDDSFEIKACISNQRCIILVGELVKLNKEVVFCNVYAPSWDSEKAKLWDFIISAQKTLDMPWCIGGDFNSVLH